MCIQDTIYNSCHVFVIERYSPKRHHYSYTHTHTSTPPQPPFADDDNENMIVMNVLCVLHKMSKPIFHFENENTMKMVSSNIEYIDWNNKRSG